MLVLNMKQQMKKQLKILSFNIKGNTMTAFVGHSGAGKSTIINLLPRFYDPQNGSIKIDNQNIKNVSLKFFKKKYIISKSRCNFI